MTGYTSFIAEGKVTNAKDFLKLCLRGFGVLVHLRDEPLSPDIPTKIEVDNYHAKKIKELKEEYEKLMSFTHLQWQEKQKEEIEKRKKTVEERMAIYKEQREVFEKIQADIQAWNCTSEYEEVKKFALHQIEISAPCYDTGVIPFEKRLEDITSKTWLKYASEVMEDIEASISYHEKKNEEEIQRAKERQDFLDGFLAQVETASKS